MKKLYFKVYQDKNNTNTHSSFYIDTIENTIKILPDLIKEAEECGNLPPVFEPIEMEESEFENLPDFQGF